MTRNRKEMCEIDQRIRERREQNKQQNTLYAHTHIYIYVSFISAYLLLIKEECSRSGRVMSWAS